jgi:hypothetical protein
MMGLERLGLAGALASTLTLGGGGSTTNEMLGRNQQTWTMRAASQAQAPKARSRPTTRETAI